MLASRHLVLRTGDIDSFADRPDDRLDSGRFARRELELDLLVCATALGEDEFDICCFVSALSS